MDDYAKKYVGIIKKIMKKHSYSLKDEDEDKLVFKKSNTKVEFQFALNYSIFDIDIFKKELKPESSGLYYTENARFAIINFLDFESEEDDLYYIDKESADATLQEILVRDPPSGKVSKEKANTFIAKFVSVINPEFEPQVVSQQSKRNPIGKKSIGVTFKIETTQGDIEVIYPYDKQDKNARIFVITRVIYPPNEFSVLSYDRRKYYPHIVKQINTFLSRFKKFNKEERSSSGEAGEIKEERLDEVEQEVKQRQEVIDEMAELILPEAKEEKKVEIADLGVEVEMKQPLEAKDFMPEEVKQEIKEAVQERKQERKQEREEKKAKEEEENLKKCREISKGCDTRKVTVKMMKDNAKKCKVFINSRWKKADICREYRRVVILDPKETCINKEDPIDLTPIKDIPNETFIQLRNGTCYDVNNLLEQLANTNARNYENILKTTMWNTPAELDSILNHSGARPEIVEKVRTILQQEKEEEMKKLSYMFEDKDVLDLIGLTGWICLNDNSLSYSEEVEAFVKSQEYLENLMHNINQSKYKKMWLTLQAGNINLEKVISTPDECIHGKGFQLSMLYTFWYNKLVKDGFDLDLLACFFPYSNNMYLSYHISTDHYTMVFYDIYSLVYERIYTEIYADRTTKDVVYPEIQAFVEYHHDELWASMNKFYKKHFSQ